MHRFSQVVVTYASTYVLVALSIDRYDAITHPMNFSGSWKRARILVAVAWLLSAIFSSPILLFHFPQTALANGVLTMCLKNCISVYQLFDLVLPGVPLALALALAQLSL